MSIKFRFAVPVMAAMLGAAAIPALAQNNNGGGGGGGGNGNNGGGGGGGRGNRGGGWNPQQMMDQLKTDLGATDDEFTAIQPKIEKVMQLQRDSRGGGMFGGGRGGRGNRGGGNNGGGQAAAETPVSTASADLEKTLADKDAKPEDIKTKLEALRAAKKAAHEDLLKAQDDLKGVLTQRQEAVLVERGMLD